MHAIEVNIMFLVLVTIVGLNNKNKYTLVGYLYKTVSIAFQYLSINICVTFRLKIHFYCIDNSIGFDAVCLLSVVFSRV